MKTVLWIFFATPNCVYGSIQARLNDRYDMNFTKVFEVGSFIADCTQVRDFVGEGGGILPLSHHI